MNLKTKNKIGIVGVSTHINDRLIFKVHGSFENNDVIQKYWDKEISHLYKELTTSKELDFVVDTVSAENTYGYKLRLLAIWDNTRKIHLYAPEDLHLWAEYLNLEGEFKLEEACELNDEECPECPEGHLMPIYDEHPNWVKFCTHCNYRAEDGQYSPLPY